jgi:phosphoglucomutase
MAANQVSVKEVPTKPIEGQKTGTSGLRKKTKEFMSENYLANWVQSLFNALGDEKNGQVLGLGGDGRYFGKEAAQIIIKLAAGNGFSKVVVGQNALMATPAMSALIRQKKLYGKCLCFATNQVPELGTADMLSTMTHIIESHICVTIHPMLRCYDVRLTSTHVA